MFTSSSSSGHDPESGPRLLFFSGGTGLRDVCPHLIRLTHDSVHLVTPFDSGGSSAHLRRAFEMPAVGDLRNRILALADLELRETRHLVELFGYRLSAQGPHGERVRHLQGIVEGNNLRVWSLPEPVKEPVLHYLRVFKEHAPADFDLRKASIGNLVLTGAYLDHGRRLNPAIDFVSSLVRARGLVRPVVEADLHLAAELEDGRVVLGQHRLTGKEAKSLDSPVRKIHLTESLEELRPASVEIGAEIRALIGTADLICYPVGSFYSSVMASLLPGGIGASVAGRDVPKVYVPNEGTDHETTELALPDAVRALRDRLAEDCRDRGLNAAPERLVNRVLVDEDRPEREPDAMVALEEMGVEVTTRELITPESEPLLDGERLAQALAAMAR